MTSHQHSIKVLLTNEDLLLGSVAKVYLEYILDANDEYFVADKKVYEQLSSKAPQPSVWKTIESYIKVTYDQCKSGEMKLIQDKLENVRGKSESISIQDVIMKIL